MRGENVRYCLKEIGHKETREVRHVFCMATRANAYCPCVACVLPVHLSLSLSIYRRLGGESNREIVSFRVVRACVRACARCRMYGQFRQKN